jgi:F-type H+-transporting ATPase subunit epsilon
MAELSVRIVAADRPVWQGAATMIVVKTVEGEIGVMPGHEPVLALLVDGVVRVHLDGGERVVAAVHQGFFSVDSDNVAVLAETAELASEIDVKRAEAALERARAAGQAGEAAVQRAEVRLRAAAHPVPHS